MTGRGLSREQIPAHLHDATCTHDPCKCRFGPLPGEGRTPSPCARCGRVASYPEATAGDVPLCHPDSGPDCYRLVTVYGHFVPGHGVWDGATGWSGDLRG